MAEARQGRGEVERREGREGRLHQVSGIGSRRQRRRRRPQKAAGPEIKCIVAWPLESRIPSRDRKGNAAYFSHNWDSAFVVGQAILPAAAFPGGSWGRRRVLVSRKSRLKAGCSHDWLPHCSCRQTPIDKTRSEE